MRVTVDHERCCSNGLCVIAAPKVFRLEDVELEYDATPDDALRPQVEEAAEMCPTQAISVE